MSELAEQSAEQMQRLEEEGEVAADYLEDLLDIADLAGDIEIDVERDRASVEIVAEGEELASLERLVGRDGEVLDSLQELTRLSVQAAMGHRSWLMLDVAGFRKKRKAEIRQIAEEAVTQAKTNGEAVKMAPMNPFERKVCHDVVAGAGLSSESEGVEPNRRVVILPASDDDTE